MPPAVSRFGPQILSGPFSHIQQSHLPHHNQQHQASGSSGLPPPSFNSHHGFPQSNLNSNVSPFAPSSNTNGLAGGFGSGNGLGGGTGLASQAAVMGFAQGAIIQQQQARDAIRRTSGGVNSGKGQMKGRIRDVWRGNLAQEMQILRGLVDKYPYISMVRPLMITTLPGIAVLTKSRRTPSFLGSLLGPWALLQPRQTIIIRRSAAMLTFYG